MKHQMINEISGSGINNETSGSGMGNETSGSGMIYETSGSGMINETSGPEMINKTTGSGINNETSGSGMGNETIVSKMINESSGSEIGNKIIVQVQVTSSKPIPVLLGECVTLTCSANDSYTTTYTYTWHHNGNTITDKTKPTLIIAGIQTHNLGHYQCTATSEYSIGSAWLVLHATGKRMKAGT